MTPKQRARLEEAAKNFGVWLLPYEVKAALVHIDALEARVGKLDGENAQMADSLVRELSREPGPCGHPQCHQYDLTPWGGDKGCVACEKDALAAERDALVKRLAERDVEVANQRTAIHTLGQLVQQAEREREEARAARDHDVEQYGRALQAYEAQVVALETAKEQAERTAAALKTAIAAVLPELVVMAHEPHCEVLAPEIRDSFRRAVQAFTAALAPTKEEA